jgi:hypothetical protein
MLKKYADPSILGIDVGVAKKYADPSILGIDVEVAAREGG